MPDFSKAIKECPVCRSYVETVEYGVCEIVKKINPKIDSDFCRKTLRLRIEKGTPVEEIARRLGVKKEELVRIVNEVSEFVDKEVFGKYLRKRRGS